MGKFRLSIEPRGSGNNFMAEKISLTVMRIIRLRKAMRIKFTILIKHNLSHVEVLRAKLETRAFENKDLGMWDIPPVSVLYSPC